MDNSISPRGLFFPTFTTLCLINEASKNDSRIRLNTKFSSYLNYIINFFSTNKRDEFESMLKKFLNVKNLFLVSQGRVVSF